MPFPTKPCIGNSLCMIGSFFIGKLTIQFHSGKKKKNIESIVSGREEMLEGANTTNLPAMSDARKLKRGMSLIWAIRRKACRESADSAQKSSKD